MILGTILLIGFTLSGCQKKSAPSQAKATGPEAKASAYGDAIIVGSMMQPIGCAHHAESDAAAAAMTATTSFNPPHLMSCVSLVFSTAEGEPVVSLRFAPQQQFPLRFLAALLRPLRKPQCQHAQP